ncbi:MBL fold metallo-hydrolase [Aestuariivivens marinum]|uniref:MBL fold metallo-hydrolase n=1 Tax=Aestuariivivens marinum TaxID=2913555 RepID=UPI001F59C9F7|nr:MBL fold metallo-hydrolase [Aestuariivivens marinum]
MKTKIIILISALNFIWSCKPSIEESVDLTTQNWIHGSENCEDNTDPPIQIVKYNSDTWILRQNKCTNYEAPFMFLFFGKNKALLMDTGATEESNIFPLYETVKKIISDWSEKNGDVELIVAHTHKHGDHYAGDGQFKGKPKTTVIGLEVEDVQESFKIKNWPEEIVDYDLGNRMMKIIPIPGHETSSIAVYDTSTKILLTGDTFYPGRLYVKDWSAFKTSIERLVKFTDNNEVSTILGNHIEMTQTPGIDYPVRTIYQPNESELPLNVIELKELSNALKKLGDIPTREVHDKFIIYPVD